MQVAETASSLRQCTQERDSLADEVAAERLALTQLTAECRDREQDLAAARDDVLSFQQAAAQSQQDQAAYVS